MYVCMQPASGELHSLIYKIYSDVHELKKQKRHKAHSVSPHFLVEWESKQILKETAAR
jgi:hypothetical protein